MTATTDYDRLLAAQLAAAEAQVHAADADASAATARELEHLAAARRHRASARALDVFTVGLVITYGLVIATLTAWIVDMVRAWPPGSPSWPRSWLSQRWPARSPR